MAEIALAVVLAAASEYVWWEGEAAAETNFANRTCLAGARVVQRDVLSGGEWVNHDGARPAGTQELFARYKVDVPQDGAWHLWTRKFWQHGPFSWRFDQTPWQTCGRD